MPEDNGNAYERQRAEIMARNRRRMEELGIHETKRAIEATAAAERAAKAPRTTKPRERKPQAPAGPARRSVRNEGRPTPNYTGMDHIGEARPFRSRNSQRRGIGPTRLPNGQYAIPSDPREWHESRGQASDEAIQAALDAALAFISEASEAAPERKDDFHWKVMSHSQCRGGYWSTATESLRTRMKIVQRSLTFILGEVTSEATLPYTACVDGTWPVVWLPHGGETRAGGKGRKKTAQEKAGAKSAGFSGGWKGFARDLMLFPGDTVVTEAMEPSTAGALPDTLKIHIFRAFDYEEDAEAIKAAAAEAWAQTEAELGLERAEKAAGEDQSEEEDEKEAEEDKEEAAVGGTLSYVTPTERLDLSDEREAAGEDDQEAQSPDRRVAGQRRRRATLTAAVATDTSEADEEEQAEEEAPVAKRRKTTQAAAQKQQKKSSKAAQKKKKAPPKRKTTKKKKAATPVETSSSDPETVSEEEEDEEDGEEVRYYVERIEDVKIDEETGQRLYYIKWETYDASENTWEPAECLDAAPETYPCAEGLVL